MFRSGELRGCWQAGRREVLPVLTVGSGAGSGEKVGGSVGWGLRWGLGKWQSVESWQDSHLLCFLEGREAGSLSRGKVPVEKGRMKDFRWNRNTFFDHRSSAFV